MGWYFLLQGIVPTQGSNPGLPHCRQTIYCLSHQGSLVDVIGRNKSARWMDGWIVKRISRWINEWKEGRREGEKEGNPFLASVH